MLTLVLKFNIDSMAISDLFVVLIVGQLINGQSAVLFDDLENGVKLVSFLFCFVLFIVSDSQNNLLHTDVESKQNNSAYNKNYVVRLQYYSLCDHLFWCLVHHK